MSDHSIFFDCFDFYISSEEYINIHTNKRKYYANNKLNNFDNVNYVKRNKLYHDLNYNNSSSKNFITTNIIK